MNPKSSSNNNSVHSVDSNGKFAPSRPISFLKGDKSSTPDFPEDSGQFKMANYAQSSLNVGQLSAREKVSHGEIMSDSRFHPKKNISAIHHTNPYHRNSSKKCFT